MKSQEAKCRICGYAMNVYPVIDCSQCGFHMFNPDEEPILMSIHGHQLGKQVFIVRSGNVILTNKRLVCVLDRDKAYSMFIDNILGGILGVVICYIVFGNITYGTLSAMLGFIVSMLITNRKRKNIGFTIPLSDILSIEGEHNKMWKSFAIHVRDGAIYRFSSGKKDELMKAIYSVIDANSYRT